MQKRNYQEGMKCYSLLLLGMMLFFVGSVANAQKQVDYQTTRITVKATNEPVEQVLNKVGSLANVRFFYNHSELDFLKNVTIDVKDMELGIVISVIFAEHPVSVAYQPNRTIVLRKAVEQQKDMQKVSGVVIDAQTGEPLAGASIVLKEQKGMGVTTNMDGQFHIEMLPGSATALLFSYVGYQQEEVRLTNRDLSKLKVKLTPMANEIEGVVVTGMAPRKAAGFTGRYVTVKADDLKRINPNNLLEALQVFDPSFRIVDQNQYGSDPNRLPEFNLRGDVQLGSSSASSFNMMMGDYSNRPNMPLFILDGFEASLQRIVDIDPERIESITILKDAAGTTLYGSKASNGVIVFETKKPASGKLNISYSANIGISVPDLSDYDLMNASEKLEYERAAGLFNSVNLMNYYNEKKKEILRGVDTYWLSQPLRTAVTHRHTLHLEGGDEAIRYSLGVNYGNEYGVMKASSRENMGLSFNLQYRYKNLNISNSLSIENTEGNNSPYGDFSVYSKMNPYYRLTDENGKYQRIIETKPMPSGTAQQVITNPLYDTQFPYKDMNRNFSVIDNFSLEYFLLENLRVQGQLSFTRSNGRNEQFRSANHTMFAQEEDITKRGSYERNLGESTSWDANASINYNLVRDKHGLFVSARWNVSNRVSDGVVLSAKGFPNDNMTDFLYAHKMEDRVSGSESTQRSVGVLGSLNYMYDQRYSVDVNVHGDLSSQFGNDTGMAPFWSTGLRWNMHEEKWLKGTLVSNLALYINIGTTGSQSYSPYQAKETYSYSDLMFPYPSGDTLGAQLMGLGNPSLGWSKTTSKTASVELGLWNGRMNFTGSYYHNYTDAMLLENNVQPSTGFASITRNVGAVLNEGVEFSLNSLLINDYKRQIQWSVGINAAHNRNVIKKLSNELKKMNEKNLSERNGTPPVYEEGQSTSVIKLVPSLGIDPATGKELFLTRDGEKTFVWDPKDKIAVGDTEPKIRGALTSSLTWKQLTAGLAFTYQLGADRVNETLINKIENAEISNNVDRRAGGPDRWSTTNRYAKYKGMGLYSQNTPSSTRFLQKYNEFALNSISVGYRLDPKQIKFLRTCRVASMSLTASMQDIFHFSTVKQERGLDYPYARSFNLSVSLLFN